MRALLFIATAMRAIVRLPLFSRFEGIVSPIALQVTENANQINTSIASSEIYVLLALVVQIVFDGVSGLFTLFLYIQFIRMRYMTSAFTQFAFRQIKVKADSFFESSSCPSIVTQGYRRSVTFLQSMTKSSPGQTPNSCVVQ